MNHDRSDASPWPAALLFSAATFIMANYVSLVVAFLGAYLLVVASIVLWVLYKWVHLALFKRPSRLLVRPLSQRASELMEAGHQDQEGEATADDAARAPASQTSSWETLAG